MILKSFGRSHPSRIICIFTAVPGLPLISFTASTKGISFNNADNAIGLAGVIGTVAAFAAEAYTLGIVTALLAGTYLLKDKYQTKLKPA